MKYLHLLYVLVFAGLSIGAATRPIVGWDVLGYRGAAAPCSNPTCISEYAHANAPRVTGENDYTRAVALNPYHFSQQLPFYSIKPLFVLAIQILTAVGVPLYWAPFIVSAVTYFLLSLLVLRWLGQPVLAAVVMLLPPVLLVARCPTPDCLGLLLVAAGFYLISVSGRRFLGCGVLVISVWARPDFVILCVLAFLWLWHTRRLDLSELGVLSLLAIGSNIIINHLAGNYGWTTLVYHSFVHKLVAPGEMVVNVAPALYARLVIHTTFQAFLSNGMFLLVLAVGCLLWYAWQDMPVGLAAVALSARVLAFALFPNADLRYLAPATLMISIAVILVLTKKLAIGNTKWIPVVSAGPTNVTTAQAHD